MSELLAEMDEAIKRERLEHIWKTYGNLILSVILLVILGTGGYSAYSGWQNSKNQKQTDLLLETEALGDPAKLSEISKDLSSGMVSVAKLRAAGAFLVKKEDAQALALYAEVAQNKSTPKEIQDLAGFMKARLSARTDPDSSISALETMSADGNNAYRFHAHLEAAVLYAHTKQDYSSALKHLNILIAEKDIPPTLNAKANALSVLYALKEKK